MGHRSYFVMGRKPAQTQIIQEQPVAPAVPPVTQTNEQVVQSAQDQRQQQLLKKNIRSTVKAGDTGGFKPLANPMKGAPNAGQGGKGYG